MTQMRTTLKDQRGGIVTGWIFRLLFGIALFGFLLYEAGAVVVTKVSVDQTAGEAASEAATDYSSHGSRRSAARVARNIAARNGAELLELKKVPGRELIEVTLRKSAPTVLLDRIGFLKRFAEAEATKRGVIR